MYKEDMKRTSLIFDVFVTDRSLFPNQNYDNFSQSLLDGRNNASYKYMQIKKKNN